MTLPYLSPLSPEQLAAVGIPSDWRFGYADRVRFSELDALNHVNNTTYLRWFETVRVHYFDDYAVTSQDKDAPQLVLKGVTADYFAPMFLHETYIVTARTMAFRNSSWTMEYGVFAGKSMRARGTAVIVLLAPDGKTKLPIPDAVRETFVSRDKARDDRAS